MRNLKNIIIFALTFCLIVAVVSFKKLQADYEYCETVLNSQEEQIKNLTTIWSESDFMLRKNNIAPTIKYSDAVNNLKKSN